jgi:outer membrane protein assembly factor BamB
MGRGVVVLLVLWPLAMAASRDAGGEASVAPHWHVAGEGRGVPAASESAVYFLTKRHEVVSLDSRTGAVRWRQHTGEPGPETLGSAVVANGNVVMAGDYAVLGFDAVSGAPKWRFDPPNGYGAGLYLGDARNEVAFAGSPAGRLMALEVSSGRLLWAAQPRIEGRVEEAAPVTVFQPTVAGDVVVAGYSRFGDPLSGGLFAVDRATGRERWHQPFPAESGRGPTGFGGGPVISGESIVASSGDGRIFGFDCGSGQIRWALPRIVRADGRLQDRDWRALAVSGSVLVAGSVSGVVTAIDLNTLTEKWRFVHPDGGSIALQLIADDESVYVPHLGGLLVAIDIRDGKERWQIGGFTDGFSWAPAIAGGMVYASASRAGLFALPR